MVQVLQMNKSKNQEIENISSKELYPPDMLHFEEPFPAKSGTHSWQKPIPGTNLCNQIHLKTRLILPHQGQSHHVLPSHVQPKRALRHQQSPQHLGHLPQPSPKTFKCFRRKTP